MIKITITPESIASASAELRAIAARVADWTPALRLVGAQIQGSVLRNFEVGGRPAWPPWARSTAKQRARRGKGRLLRFNATLQNSLQQAAALRITGPRSLEIGTNVQYAAAHQFGFTGTVQIPEHLRRVRSRDVWARVERTSKKTGKRYKQRVVVQKGTTTVHAHPAHLRIPPRPFLMIQPEDWRMIEQTLDAHLKGDLPK